MSESATRTKPLARRTLRVGIGEAVGVGEV
jgi:hypothetical protein